MTTTPDPVQPISDGLNDSLRGLCENSRVPVGVLAGVIARWIRYRQHEGRPIAHFWGGWQALVTGATSFRFARFDMLDGGCANFGAIMHAINLAADPASTAGVDINGNHSPSYGAATGAFYPTYLLPIDCQTPVRSPAVATGTTIEEVVGFDSIYPMAGCFFERSVAQITDIDTTLAVQGFRSGADIIAEQTGSYGTTDRLIERFGHVWTNRRITYSWFTQEDSYVEFAESSQAYRYIFDQLIGTGGTAPSSTGPGITLPHRYSAAGLDLTVRVYVWVYAAMSGTTDSGTIAVANKNTSGIMGAMAALNNPQTIGGTGFAWYPSLGSFDPTTHPYFDSPTDIDFDRVLLGGRSEGATDKLRVRGWMMAVYPAR